MLYRLDRDICDVHGNNVGYGNIVRCYAIPIILGEMRLSGNVAPDSSISDRSNTKSLLKE